MHRMLCYNKKAVYGSCPVGNGFADENKVILYDREIEEVKS